jgi:hypothetical protein
VKVRYNEGVAIHICPELSAFGVRRARRRFSVGVRPTRPEFAIGLRYVHSSDGVRSVTRSVRARIGFGNACPP